MNTTRRNWLQAVTAGLALNALPEVAEAAEPLTKLLTPEDATTRLVDQDGKLFNPASLDGRTTMACSGFYRCPICQKIKATMANAMKRLDAAARKDMQVIVFTITPEDDYEQRDKYIKSYVDAGFDAKQVKILFTQTKGPGGEWKADDVAAKKIEGNFMLNSSPRGHSTGVYVFYKDGKRGKLIAANVDAGARQNEQARKISEEINAALANQR